MPPAPASPSTAALTPTPPAPAPLANMGESAPRYEARLKVTGQAAYAADMAVPRPAYAYLLTSAIARGIVTAIDEDAARAVPGVIEIFTYRNAPQRKAPTHFNKGGDVADSILPLSGPEVHFGGQIIAMVLAESWEAARDAAQRLDVRYAEATPSAGLDSPGADTKADPKGAKSAGDFDGAYAAAPVKIDARYATPTQHHNPMELFSTTASWSNSVLTLLEPSQYVYGLRAAVARSFGIAKEDVRVISPYVGGAFGSKGIMTQRTLLVAAAARQLARPVKLVATRQQGFTVSTYRAETKHHVRLGADRSGKISAYGHEGWELTSRHDDYSVNGTSTTTEMYGAKNIKTAVNLVQADRSTPGFMRSPPEVPYMFALESAIDELAVELGIDPIELRRINDTKISPVSGMAFSSRSLMQCFDAAAASFGWARRTPAPGSMRDGDWLIGWGAATAVYPTHMMASTARVRLTRAGAVHVQCACADVGQGAYSALRGIAADLLKLPVENVTVETGDSALPAGPVAGGSMTTASAGSSVHAAVQKIVARFGNAMPPREQLAAAFDRLGVDTIEEYAEWAPPGGPPGKAVAMLKEGKIGGGGGDPSKKTPMYAFGAELVEVRVHRLTREIRVPRMTGAFATGRVVNPRTARSQHLGGMIWGMASALLEATEIDEKRARYVNDDLAEYLLAVNADVPQVDVILVPEVDTQVNPLGVKGVGELANVGTNAAIANAVFHATGKRIRELPITIDKLI